MVINLNFRINPIMFGPAWWRSTKSAFEICLEEVVAGCGLESIQLKGPTYTVSTDTSRL